MPALLAPSNTQEPPEDAMYLFTNILPSKLAGESCLRVYPMLFTFGRERKMDFQSSTKGRRRGRQAAMIWREASMSGQYATGLR